MHTINNESFEAENMVSEIYVMVGTYVHNKKLEEIYERGYVSFFSY